MQQNNPSTTQGMTSDTCYNTETNLENIMIRERTQTQKVKYCIILFELNIQIRAFHGDRKQTSVFSGPRSKG
jgi:hypothetical protein